MLNPAVNTSKYSEPWFSDQLISLTGKKEWTKEDRIIWNQIQRQGDKHKFFMHAFEFISDNGITGDYHEFGCHRCRTFRMAMLESKRHFLEDMRFWAYDSFEGLPELDNEKSEFGRRWEKGQLKTDEEEFKTLIRDSGLSVENVITKKGFYEESLPAINLNELDSINAVLVTIDCDLYESAVPIFKYIETIIQEGTIIYIDDYFTGYKGNPNKGVSLAFKEWLDGSAWSVEKYRDVGWAGRSYIAYK